MREYLIVTTEIEPLDQSGMPWFEYQVIHKPSGTIAPQGKSKAKNADALKKRLRAQIQNKLRDPHLVPPRNTLSRDQMKSIFINAESAAKSQRIEP